jgi:glycosyltransferase involved in cell wall biosynthesis
MGLTLKVTQRKILTQPTLNANHTGPPILGYLARMCREKGLDTLIQAFILLRQRGRVPRP